MKKTWFPLSQSSQPGKQILSALRSSPREAWCPAESTEEKAAQEAGQWE